MNDNILFVFPDAQKDYFEDLEEELKKKLQGGASMVVKAQDTATAWELIIDPGNLNITLIIAYIELPEKRKVAPTSDAAILLENRLRKNEIKTPMVIVVPKFCNKIAQQVSQLLSHIRDSDPSLGDSIVDLVKKHKKPEKHVDIVLNLSDQDDASAWSYIIKGKNFQAGTDYYDGKLKKPSPQNLKNCLYFTNEVDSKLLDKSEEAVHFLRDNLNELLYEDNNQKSNTFSNALESALRQVDNLEQTRVQFVVDEKVYPICFEAIMSPKAGNENMEKSDYWMQHAPLVRHVRCKESDHTLFQEGLTRPTNVLIISSNVSGPFNLGKHRTEAPLKKLANVEAECTKLKQHLDQLKVDGVNLGDIRVITSSKNNCCLDYIQKVLDEKTGDDRWDIVHYAGHSYYDENTGGAYVFFKDSENFNKAVEIEKFAESLSRTRLLVLSSCASANKGFMFELAKYQIPAVLGFRTEIEDDLARKFSKYFFRNLFELRSIDRAFFQARKELYENDNAHCAWTNPILVLDRVA